MRFTRSKKLLPAFARTRLHQCGKSCRLRWTNYLWPDLKRGLLSNEEERMLVELHALHHVLESEALKSASNSQISASNDQQSILKSAAFDRVGKSF
jgi:hypothetical protein